MFDVIVVGGSYAGMAAALQIARARRNVLVLDAGLPRNRFAHTAHGVLGHDGRPPSDIAADARNQLLAYPNLKWREATATSAEKHGSEFIVGTDDGETSSAKRLILATGIIDELPEIPGLAERWGRSVLHCPYCHGYELDNGHLGVLAAGEWSMHQSMLIPDWGKTTLFTNGAFEPDEEQLVQLKARDVTVEREMVSEISGDRASVKLRDGRVIELAGLFVAPRIASANPLAEHLGCVLEEGPLGFFIKTDGMKETSVPGVFACGDVAGAAGSISFAIGGGALAGGAAHQSLIFRPL